MIKTLSRYRITDKSETGESHLSEKIYRDSVHNIIRLRTDSDEGKLLVRLIDTAEFQRLRRIRQLGLAHFAYQGAEHSRFAHSLGALHLATRTLAKLELNYDISPESRIAVRCAALLHDIGHGAFSHVIEPILRFQHEEFTVEALLSLDTEVGRTLAAFDRELPERVASIIRGDYRPRALAQLVSSQLDVDRMDYLLRDSLMTGAKYGIFDLEWIIKSLEIDEVNDRLYVAARGLYAVEDYLQARYYMFRQVYFHRTLRAAEAVLHSMLRRAFRVFANDPNGLYVSRQTAFEKILKGERLTLREHLELDDHDVMFHIKRWESSNDPVLADLAGRFLHRRLFKAFDLDMPEDRRASFLRQSRELAEAAGFDPEFYLIEDRAGDVAHYFYARDDSNSKDLIFVEDGFSNPTIREISQISGAVRGLQEGYRINRVCFPGELKRKIAELYHG